MRSCHAGELTLYDEVFEGGAVQEPITLDNTLWANTVGMHARVYVYMHVCMHVCMYVCMHTCESLALLARTHALMHMHICTYMHTYTHPCTAMHIHAHPCTCTNAQVLILDTARSAHCTLFTLHALHRCSPLAVRGAWWCSQARRAAPV